MASTFTTNLALELQATGEHSGTWGTVLNTADFTILDNVLGGVQTISLSNIPVTISTSQSQNNIIKLTGVLTGDVTVTFPAIGRTFYVINATTGAFTVTLACAGGGATTVIQQGTGDFFVLNAVDVLNTTAAQPAASLTVAGVTQFATTAEYLVGTVATKALVVDQVWAAAALAVLTDAATIAVDFSAGINFGAAANAPLSLAGDRTLGAPTNLKPGQSGTLWFTASGSTRILTLNAAWKLATSLVAGPYSITTSQVFGIVYFCRSASVVYVTATMTF